MRTTIALDDDLLQEAQRLTGQTEKTALVREALPRPHTKGKRAEALEAGRNRTCSGRYKKAKNRGRVILVDSSVWVEHLGSHHPTLARLLQEQQVIGHPWVVGELSLGHLVQRTEILQLLRSLPQAIVASDAEVLALIDGHQLHGRGIGYVDAHLLAATLLAPGARLWTLDKRLAEVAADLGCAAQPV